MLFFFEAENIQVDANMTSLYTRSQVTMVQIWTKILSRSLFSNVSTFRHQYTMQINLKIQTTISDLFVHFESKAQVSDQRVPLTDVILEGYFIKLFHQLVYHIENREETYINKNRWHLSSYRNRRPCEWYEIWSEKTLKTIFCTNTSLCFNLQIIFSTRVSVGCTQKSASGLWSAPYDR